MSDENNSAESPEQKNVTPAVEAESGLMPIASQDADGEVLQLIDSDGSLVVSPATDTENDWFVRRSRLKFPAFIPEDESFPWQALPETIRAVVLEICKNDKLAVPIAVQAVLSGVSLSCQDLIWVDRGVVGKSVCSLYMLAVTDSGSRKSKADEVVTSSIEGYDRRMRAEYIGQKQIADLELRERQRKRRELEKASGTLRRKSYTLTISGKADAERLASAAKTELDAVEHEIANLHRQDFEYREPRLRRVFYSKIPIRELEQQLAVNWPSAGLFSDEAAGILNARGESDMSSLDKLWEGKAIDAVGRAARETVFVEDPRLTISLMVQPVVFDRFIERKGDLAKGIGFMSRILLSRPDTPYGKRSIDSTEQRQTDWTNIFNERIRSLLEHAHADIALRDRLRKTLYFAPAAQKIWEENFNEMESAMAEGGRLVNEREFVNRFSEHVARLAALFHFFENGKLADSSDVGGADSSNLAIPESVVTAAIDVVTWYMNEFGRVFNPDVSMKEMATYVMKQFRQMLENQNGGPLEAPTMDGSNCQIPFHELRANCSRFDLKKTEKLREVLNWLQRRGNIDLIESEKRQKGMVARPKNLKPEMVAIRYEIKSWRGGVSGYEFFYEIKDRPRTS